MTSAPVNTTRAERARRAPAKAGGGLKYLVTAATVAAVVGGWGLIAAPTAGPVEQANAGSAPAAVAPAAGEAAVATGPTLAAAPASGPQPAPAPVTTSLRAVTAPMNQPVVRTRSSR